MAYRLQVWNDMGKERLDAQKVIIKLIIFKHLEHLHMNKDSSIHNQTIQHFITYETDISRVQTANAKPLLTICLCGLQT